MLGQLCHFCMDQKSKHKEASNSNLAGAQPQLKAGISKLDSNQWEEMFLKEKEKKKTMSWKDREVARSEH